VKSPSLKSGSSTNAYSSLITKESGQTFFGNESHQSFFNPVPVQTKLSVNEPDDKYEREADVMEDKVMRAIAAPGDNGNETNHADQTTVQRKCAACEVEEKEVQRKEAGTTGTSITEATISAKNFGAGKSWNNGSKGKMESAFGTSFSDVNIYSNKESAAMCEDLDAHAFTYGQDIFFNKEKYNPGTVVGDALLAHELAHTIQQKGATEIAPSRQAVETESNMVTPEGMRYLWRKPENNEKAKKVQAKRKLSIQRCSKKETPPVPQKIMDEIIKEPEKKDARIVNVRGSVDQNQFKQDLAQIDILVTGGTLKKKSFDNKTTEVYELNVFTTNYTEADIASEFALLFPAGSETTIEKKSDDKLTQIKRLIAAYRVKHPNSFSKLQAHNLMSGSCETGACIGTLNTGVQQLYGNKTVDQGSLGEKLVTDPKNPKEKGSIDILKERGLTGASFTIGAQYDATKPVPLAVNEVTLTSSLGQTVIAAVQNKEDGMYTFLLSISNGYHSVTIIVYKVGTTIEVIWRDQHWTDPGTDRTTPKSPQEMDGKLIEFLVGSGKYWVAKRYNKLYDPDVSGIDQMTDASKKDAAMKAAEPDVRSDFTKTVLVMLKPAQAK